MSETDRISPTAFATGHMWVRLGLSHPAMSTPRGVRLDRAFSLAIQPRRLLGGTGAFDTLMRARHTGIDCLLEQAIESGKLSQVIELAAGLSGRGWRMTQKFPDLTYIETDLPAMAELKHGMLDGTGLLSDRHQVRVVDALTDAGPESLAALIDTLDSSKGTAIITEGLMSYMDPDTAVTLWQRISGQLKRFPQGLYLSDGYVQSEVKSFSSTLIKTILQRFVKGGLYTHYSSAEDATQKLTSNGFARASLHAARDLPATRELGTKPGGSRVRVLEAWV